MTHCILQTQLRRLGWQVRGVGGVSGLGWGLVAMALTVMASAWADLVFELTPTLRLAALASGMLTGLVLSIAVAWRCRLQSRAAALARRLDQVVAARGEIIAGVALLEEHNSFGLLGDGLAGIAVERAMALARVVPGSRVVSVRPVLTAALAGGLLAGGAGLVALGLPRLAQAQWLRFTDPFGDHPPYSAVLFQIEPGEVSVIYGQGVEIRAKVEGAPVDRLELVLELDATAPERVPMFPAASGSRWPARWTRWPRRPPAPASRMGR